MPNVNVTTGYSYGYLSGRAAPELLEHIQDTGRDLTYEEWSTSFKEDLQRVLAEYTSGEPLEDLESSLLHIVDVYSGLPASDQRSVVLEALGYVDEDSLTFDIQEIVDCIFDYVTENDFQEGPEEPVHELQEHGCHYRTSWLGGAPNIWVLDSPYVTYCRTCSPCVPGAGDLDNCTAQGAASCLAHCPPAEDWTGWEEIRDLQGHVIATPQEEHV